jgi:hypothetical protein
MTSPQGHLISETIVPVRGERFPPNHPVPAKLYAPYLIGYGFNTVSPENYTPEMGDIRVWQPYLGDSKNYGHIDMYNGNQWVSDFKENNPWPGSGYRDDPHYQIFRWPGQ